MTDLPALRKLCAEATDGPWGDEKETRTGAESLHRFVYAGMPPDGGGGIGTTIAQWVSPPNAAFIAAARSALPALLDELEQCRAARLAQMQQYADLLARVDEAIAVERRSLVECRAALKEATSLMFIIGARGGMSDADHDRVAALRELSES